jgi:hypothetical protein
MADAMSIWILAAERLAFSWTLVTSGAVGGCEFDGVADPAESFGCDKRDIVIANC